MSGKFCLGQPAPQCRFSTTHRSCSLPRVLSSCKETCWNEEEAAGGFPVSSPTSHSGCQHYPGMPSVSRAWPSSLRAKKMTFAESLCCV